MPKSTAHKIAEPEAPARPSPEAPAIITAMHKRDRGYVTEIQDGKEKKRVVAPDKAWRRIDRLRWLLDHKAIGDHQFRAGRRLQEDWQTSKIEVSPRMGGSRGGGNSSVLSDAALDAGTRLKDALAILPQELLTLLTLFLLPEDHPFSLERCAAMVREDRRAASYGIRIGLTLLSRHYGYGG